MGAGDIKVWMEVVPTVVAGATAIGWMLKKGFNLIFASSLDLALHTYSQKITMVIIGHLILALAMIPCVIVLYGTVKDLLNSETFYNMAIISLFVEMVLTVVGIFIIIFRPTQGEGFLVRTHKTIVDGLSDNKRYQLVYTLIFLIMLTLNSGILAQAEPDNLVELITLAILASIFPFFITVQYVNMTGGKYKKCFYIHETSNNKWYFLYRKDKQYIVCGDSVDESKCTKFCHLKYEELDKWTVYTD